MSKLERKNHKVFGINATETKVGQFGSANATTKINTKDVEKIQALDAWEQGWEAGAVGNKRYPTQQERTGVDYEHSYQIGYMLQEGIPEWNKDTTYNKGSIIKLVRDTKIVLYNSLQDNNKNNALTNTDYWEKLNLGGSGKELLEIYIDPFCDESENKGRIANGQIIIQSQFKDVTKKLKKRVGWDSENKKATLNTSLVCTEEEWQAIKTASKLGQCGKFVIDDEAGTIRLPAIININGLTDLSKAGLIKDESLPNIKGSVNFAQGPIYLADIADSALYGTHKNTKNQPASTTPGDKYEVLKLDASRSSFTYQDNAPVQQEAVQYPYVICVNTGVEEAERPINNYQVNNTNSYGDNKYVGDMTLNNLSWLKSEGQVNSGTIYTGFYNWAVANIGQPFGAGYITGPKMYGYSKDADYHYATINEVPKVGDPVYGAGSGMFIGNIESVDIANASITFHNPLQQNESVIASRDTKYDVTTTNPYFLIVDQANQTFILPTLNGSEVLPSDKYENLTLGAGSEKHIAPANGWIVLNKISKTSPKFVNAYTGSNGRIAEMMSSFNGQQVKYSFFIRKGEKYIVDYNADGNTRLYRFVYAKGNGNLYYYVGDTLQNADLINIARMQEELVNKVNKKQATQASMPSGKYINLTLGASGTPYIAPADGWFVINKRSTGPQQYVNIGKVDSISTIGSFTAYASGVECWSVQSVLAGEEVKVFYTCAGKLEWFRFIYAVGSKPST